MRKSAAKFCLLASAAIFGMGVIAAPALAKTKPPKISAVKFSGYPSEPLVTIKGTGLGSLPFGEASPVPTCFESEPTGDNFGTTVTFSEISQGWGAGEGSEGGGDCIGIIFKAYTETEVVYHFGSAYREYSAVQDGDSYRVTLYGLSKEGTVKGLKKPKK